MEWISVKDKIKIPNKGEIIVVWLSGQQEPACVRYDEDKYGPIYIELVAVNRELDREDIITHWMSLPEPPKDL